MPNQAKSLSPLSRLPLLLGLALAVTVGSGCQSGGVGPIARWRMAFDQSVASSPTAAEIGDTRGLIQRWLSPKPPGTSSIAADTPSTLVLGSDGWSPLQPPRDPVADAEYEAAEARFQQGDYAAAESQFAKIAKLRKGTHWGEKSQFHLAECQFQRGKFTAAHDSFERLIATHPGSQYLDKAVSREFEIAQTWLGAVDPNAKPEAKSRWGDRFKGKFPVLDTSGNALAALEHVRQHDPTGPMADDAVMKIADYHHANGNWDDASSYYDELITNHPKSPFIQQAMLSSIDSKMKGYLGPDYDGTGLEKAREQVMLTMTSFPEQQVSHSESLHDVLDRIDEQMAERAYKLAERYLWTGKVQAAEYGFGEIPIKWPKSPLAAKAKDQLAKIATMPRNQTKASRIMTQPGGSDPYTGSPGVSGGSFGANGGASPNGMGLGGLSGP